MIKLAAIPSTEVISLCAGLIWENEGCPDGRDQSHWYEAEDQLMACHVYDHWMLPPVCAD